MKQTALITGAAKRLGKAVAFHLAEQGWSIAIHYHSSEGEAQSLKDELSAKFPDQIFELFRANMENATEVEELIPSVIAKMQKIDLLINNASVFESSTLQNTSTDLFNRQMNVNLRAPFILSKIFSSLFKKGLIINFTDTRIVTNQSSHAAYTVSKKALWEMTKMAALEFGPGIRANAIAPGLTLAPEGKSDRYLLELSEKIAMKRPGGINPILKSLDFIIENDYLTGQILFCDGGENLGSTN